MADGVFANVNVLKTLMTAGTQRAKYIPILANESFRFPSKVFFDENWRALEEARRNPGALAFTVTEVFKAIAVVFQPQEYSATEEVLSAKADAVAERCIKQDLLKELVYDEQKRGSNGTNGNIAQQKN